MGSVEIGLATRRSYGPATTAVPWLNTT